LFGHIHALRHFLGVIVARMLRKAKATIIATAFLVETASIVRITCWQSWCITVLYETVLSIGILLGTLAYLLFRHILTLIW